MKPSIDDTHTLVILLAHLMIYHICYSSSIHLNALSFAMNVVIGHLMCFNRWIHCFIGLNDDIHCDLFIEWIHWMI
jgi:hypothetical protein